MNFVTVEFGVFFVAVMVVYWQLPRRAQNVFLLISSWVFYAAWDWRFLSLIIVSTGTDFLAGRRIHSSTRTGVRRAWLLASLAVNLGILGYFKYANFFVDSLESLAAGIGWHLSTPTLNIILPVGISFYTFQTLSYTLDIYLRRLEPTRSLIDFGAFVAFFPQLVAGPIVRAREFLYQLDEPRRFELSRFEAGASRFLTGFFKKAFIADTLGIFLVDPVFASPGDYGSGTLWLALLGYTAQIYADFSGYSSMAIGAAAMLGFSIPENFNFPYLATDFSDFWRRWHMTMSRFFRDYVYIPLGGSRSSSSRTRVNLAVTTLVSGLWHGASWPFVAWGGLHGIFIMINHRVRERLPAAHWSRAVGGWVLTFTGVMFAWILFRAQSFGDAWLFLTSLWGAPGQAVSPPLLVWVALGAVVLDHIAGWVGENHPALKVRVPAPARAAFFVFLILMLHHTKPVAASPFIYFQF